MNIPNRIATTENGVIFYSNRMPEAYGIHSYISGEKIKVERIDVQHFLPWHNGGETTSPSWVLSIVLILAFFSVALVFINTIFSSLFFGIALFLGISSDDLSALHKKFRYIRKKNKTYQLAMAAQSICDFCKEFDRIPSKNDKLEKRDKKDYGRELYALICDSIRSILFAILYFSVAEHFLIAYNLNFFLLLFPGVIVITILGKLISLGLKKLDIVKHFERFFVTQSTELDLQIAIAGLNEWLQLEKEIEDFNNSSFLKN